MFVGVRLGGSAQEHQELLQGLLNADYQVKDLTDNELAKLHLRYMIGGKNPNTPDISDNERLFSFEFPEYPGALETFLAAMGEHWNITLFHYRNHGAAFGQVLAGFNLDNSQQEEFFQHIETLGYQCQEETDNPAYQTFLN